jgi:hypothetical protein
MANNVIVKGVPELRAAFRKARAQALETLKNQIEASGCKMATEAQQNLGGVGAVDTARLQGETCYRSSDGGLGAEVAAPNPVAAAVEFGTAPAGQLKQHQPPSAPLEAWGARHGFPPGSGFIIARAIRLRGIRARPWLSKAHTTIAPKFVRDLTAALNRMLSSL